MHYLNITNEAIDATDATDATAKVMKKPCSNKVHNEMNY